MSRRSRVRAPHGVHTTANSIDFVCSRFLKRACCSHLRAWRELAREVGPGRVAAEELHGDVPTQFGYVDGVAYVHGKRHGRVEVTARDGTTKQDGHGEGRTDGECSPLLGGVSEDDRNEHERAEEFDKEFTGEHRVKQRVKLEGGRS